MVDNQLRLRLPKDMRLLLVALLLVALPRAANAYIDPSAGSIVVQLLLGGVAGLFVVVKLGYRRLLDAFGIRRRPLESAQEDSGPDPDR
jgi:hypothetical protein